MFARATNMRPTMLRLHCWRCWIDRRTIVVSLWVVHYWIARGIIPAVQRKRNAPYAITIDNELDCRLREWILNSAHLLPRSRTQSI